MRFDQAESYHILVNLVVCRTEEFSAQAAVHGGSPRNTAFAGGVPEESAVGDGALLRDDACVAGVGVPGVEVRVEVDDTDGAVDCLEGAEYGEDDGVVAS